MGHNPLYSEPIKSKAPEESCRAYPEPSPATDAVLSSEAAKEATKTPSCSVCASTRCSCNKLFNHWKTKTPSCSVCASTHSTAFSETLCKEHFAAEKMDIKLTLRELKTMQ